MKTSGVKSQELHGVRLIKTNRPTNYICTSRINSYTTIFKALLKHNEILDIVQRYCRKINLFFFLSAGYLTTLSVTDYTPSNAWTILNSELEGIWKVKKSIHAQV